MKDVSKHQPDQHGARSRDEPSQPPFPADARSRVSAARRWAIAHGRTLSTPALAAILGAKSSRDDEPIDWWTGATVCELMWTDIITWCQGREAACPERVAETLWTYLSFLADENALEAGSDTLADLRAPLTTIGGLNRDGRERARGRRPPTERARPARSQVRLAPVVPLRRSKPR